MIHGNKEVKIVRYLQIDHCSKGCSWITPKFGEKFIGIPYGWVEENSIPFIEITMNGKLIKSINALDLSEIEFYND